MHTSLMHREKPSPKGEGLGEGKKIEKSHFISPHPGLLLYALWVLWRRGANNMRQSKLILVCID
jgi:hypothetical protein